MWEHVRGKTLTDAGRLRQQSGSGEDAPTDGSETSDGDAPDREGQQTLASYGE